MKHLIGSKVGERTFWFLILSILVGGGSEIAYGQPISGAVHDQITVDKGKIAVYDSAHIDRLQQILRIAKVVYYPAALKPTKYFEGYNYNDVCSDGSELNTDPQNTSPDSWLIVKYVPEDQETSGDNRNTEMIGWRLTINGTDNHEDTRIVTLEDVCDVLNQCLSNGDHDDRDGNMATVRNQWVLASEYPIIGKSKERWLWTEEEILDRNSGLTKFQASSNICGLSQDEQRTE